jgi:transposase
LKLEFSAPESLGWEERKAMKASKFSDAQKAFILKQGADGVPVADICRRAGISQATYFNWKKKYEGARPAGDAAGRHSPKNLRPGRKRELVGMMSGEWQVSIRRACTALEFDRSTYHYRSCRPDQAPLAARIKTICETRVRYGWVMPSLRHSSAMRSSPRRPSSTMRILSSAEKSRRVCRRCPSPPALQGLSR